MPRSAWPEVLSGGRLRYNRTEGSARDRNQVRNTGFRETRYLISPALAKGDGGGVGGGALPGQRNKDGDGVRTEGRAQNRQIPQRTADAGSRGLAGSTLTREQRSAPDTAGLRSQQTS